MRYDQSRMSLALDSSSRVCRRGTNRAISENGLGSEA